VRKFALIQRFDDSGMNPSTREYFVPLVSVFCHIAYNFLSLLDFFRVSKLLGYNNEQNYRHNFVWYTSTRFARMNSISF
jgi:hypothetical protein